LTFFPFLLQVKTRSFAARFRRGVYASDKTQRGAAAHAMLVESAG
jgi:hypothetical protein